MKKLLLLFAAMLVTSLVGNSQNYTSWYVNVLGGFNNWTDNGIQPTNNDNPVVLHPNLPIGTTEFKIKVWDGEKDIWFGNGSAIPQNEWVSVSTNTGNMTISGATEGQTFDVEWNCKTNQLRITKAGTGGGGGGEVTPPATGGNDLYVVGQMNDWTATDAYKMTNNGNGTYTLKLASLNGPFKIKDADPEWKGVNLGGEGVYGDDSITEVEAVEGSQNMWQSSSVNLVATNMTNVTLTLTYPTDVEGMAILVISVDGNGGGGEVTPPTPTGDDLYLAGDMNDWTATDAYKMTNNGNGTYTLKLASLNGAFKIKDADPEWKGVNLGGEGVYGDDSITEVEAVEGSQNMWQGSSVNLVAHNLTNVTLTLTYPTDVEGMAILVISADGNGGGGEVTPPTPTGDDLYLAGDMNDWTATDAYKMTNNGNGTYTLKLASLNGAFKIKDADPEWNGVNLGGEGVYGDDSITEVEAVEGSQNMWQNSSVNLVAHNMTNVTLTLTYPTDVDGMAILVISADGNGGGGEVTPPTPTGDDLYLVGDMNEWTTTDAYKMTNNGNGIYTLNLASLNGEFKIKDADPEWNGVNLGGEGVYGDDSITVVEAIEGSQNMWQNSSVNLVAHNMTNVTLTLTYPTDVEGMAILVISKTSGVEAIEAEGEAVYFNLQGQKIANPDKGIYVKVVNGKAVKVIK